MQYACAILSYKVTEYKMCVLIVASNSVGSISHSKNNRARYKKRIPVLRQYRLGLSDFNGNGIIATDFQRIMKYPVQ